MRGDRRSGVDTSACDRVTRPWAALLALIVAVCGFGPTLASEEPEVRSLARFEQVAELVRERYWDLAAANVDWQEIVARHRAELAALPHAPAAGGRHHELDDLLVRMVDAIGDDHSRFVPPGQVQEVRDAYGDLPCIGVFAQAGGGSDEAVHWRPEGRLGVIRVPDLVRAGTATDLRGAVIAAQRHGVEGLVLDLRGNPGGRLTEMMAAAGVFQRGLLWRIVTRWSLPLPYPAVGTPATDLPLAVWIDGDVHSAAEGLAGALQFSGRAIVIGERSAGNVETVLPFCLRDGAQLWLATGVLAPLTGPTWAGVGVMPDVPAKPQEALPAALEALLGTP